MIEEVGTVVELKEQRIAVVMCKRNSACEHCPSTGSCSMGAGGETMLVDAVNTIRAQVGDEVKVVASTKHFLQSSFMLYIVPIIGLLIGALIGQAVGEKTALGIDPSLLSAFTAVIFLIITFLFIRLATMRLKREAFMPRIISKQAV